MFEFAYIWVFLALPLPLLVWRIAPPHRETVSALRTPFLEPIAKALGEVPREGSAVLTWHWIQTATAVLVWCLLLVALAKPQWVGEAIVKTEAGRDVMLAIDISGSMDKRDFVEAGDEPVSRLDAVKQVVGDFIEAREGDRVGLIIFGSSAYVQAPFTRDLTTARALLDAVEVGMAGPHTALGDAIGLAIRTFEVSELEQRLLILLTDGADTGSRMSPINAAAIAAENDVIIHTIGVGDPEGSGEDRVDFATLEKIASAANGRFFSADDAAELAEVYAEIDKLTPTETKSTTFRPRRSLVHWPAGAALALAILGLSLMLIRRRTVSRVSANG